MKKRDEERQADPTRPGQGLRLYLGGSGHHGRILSRGMTWFFPSIRNQGGQEAWEGAPGQ